MGQVGKYLGEASEAAKPFSKSVLAGCSMGEGYQSQASCQDRRLEPEGPIYPWFTEFSFHSSEVAWNLLHLPGAILAVFRSCAQGGSSARFPPEGWFWHMGCSGKRWSCRYRKTWSANLWL